jgi:hypothetical protein
MVSVVGTYQNGKLTLDKELASESPLKVVVTFLENVSFKESSPLLLSDFSFSKSRAVLKNYDGSLSDAVIEERRKELWLFF